MDKLEPLENERWVWAKTFKEDYSDEYLVSDMGRCYNCKTKRFVWKVDRSFNIDSFTSGINTVHTKNYIYVAVYAERKQ